MGLISRVSSRTYRKSNPKNIKKMQLFIQGSSQLSNISVSNEAEFITFLESTESNLESINLSVNGAPVEAFEELAEGNTVQVLTNYLVVKSTVLWRGLVRSRVRPLKSKLLRRRRPRPAGLRGGCSITGGLLLNLTLLVKRRDLTPR